MSVLTKKERPVKWLRVGKLSVEWVDAQRPIREKKVADIMENFDPDAFGVIAAAQLNGSGDQYHIIDGQHRVEAVRRLYGDSEMVPAELITGCETVADAARAWLGRNVNQSPPSALERFRVRLAAGDEEAHAINTVIEAFGFKVAAYSGYNHITAVGAVESVYRKWGAKGLGWVLGTLSDTWGVESAAVQAGLLKGYAIFYSRFGPVADVERLARTVSAKYTPDRMLGSARTAKAITGQSIAEAVASNVIQVYNTKLQKNRLEVA